MHQVLSQCFKNIDSCNPRNNPYEIVMINFFILQIRKLSIERVTNLLKAIY